MKSIVFRICLIGCCFGVAPIFSHQPTYNSAGVEYPMEQTSGAEDKTAVCPCGCGCRAPCHCGCLSGKPCNCPRK